MLSRSNIQHPWTTILQQTQSISDSIVHKRTQLIVNLIHLMSGGSVSWYPSSGSDRVKSRRGCGASDLETPDSGYYAGVLRHDLVMDVLLSAVCLGLLAYMEEQLPQP